MNDHIFRAYDIRGVADADLTDEVVYGIGRALGSMARERGGLTFGLGRDCRHSGPRLRNAMARGLASCGLQVIDFGEIPTPLLYFAVHTRGLGGGVQITGSHNPPEYNGFKMMIGLDTLQDARILEIRERIQAQRYEEADGVIVEDDIRPAYLDAIASDIRLGPTRLRVVLDGGNGIAGPTAMALFERLGVDVVGSCITPDGSFPNHHPDPTTLETVEVLRGLVQDHDADLAIGFDGDGDRLGVVDAAGDVQWGDRLMILFARQVLREQPGATIVSEVKCSRAMYDAIADAGGEAIMWRTGHSPIKAKMRETGALLGGEMSGHIFFKHRYYGFDDAIYAAARLVELLSHAGATISELLSDVPPWHATPEIRIDCADALKFDLVAELVARVRRDYKLNAIDGARIDFDDGWGLVRASNTQPVLVMRAEARTPERRDEIATLLATLVDEARAHVERSGAASEGV